MMLLAAPQPHTPAERFGIGKFVLLSATLHAVLLGGWLRTHSTHFGSETGVALNVTLNTIVNHPAPAPTKSLPAPETTNKQKSTKTKQRKAADHTPPPAAAQEKALKQHEPQLAATNRSSRTKQNDVEQRDKVIGRIRLELSRHFRYPLQARRLGWQGTVLLAFRLAPDGQIEAINIKRSSGYRLLDEAATKALGKVSPVALDKGHMMLAQDLTLPVIYHIEGR